MAEFLIYDKLHWMDTLSNDEYNRLRSDNEHFEQKFYARYQRGDIVEVRPDGFFTGPKARGFNEKAFRLVVVKGLKPDKAIVKPLVTNEIVTPIQNEENNNVETILKKRKYALPNISGTKKIVSMTAQEFESAIVEKT